MDIVAISVISLGVIGAVSAVILYFIAQRFKVEEDPRIDEVESLLPGANCGGCGKAGCRNFAESCVKATSLDGLFCPVGGGEVMKKVAGVLGMEAADATPRVAVVRCNGTCENRPRVNIYEGAASCAIVNSLYGGETACAYGCLGYGSCVKACPFDAIHIVDGIAVVDKEACKSCGKCVEVCPKHLIELIPYKQQTFVQCNSNEKGKALMSVCEVGCIGCRLCEKNCEAGAVTVNNFLAHIDADKCTNCGVCAEKCPRKIIRC